MLTQTKHTYRPGLGKSVAHDEIQRYLKKQIPNLELEKSMGTRRADGVWEEKKLVFEVQISPITLQEAKQRCLDYASLGYRVVWILHETIFNGKKVSNVEQFLRKNFPTYFTNGSVIYDQIEVIDGYLRLYKGEPLPVKIACPCVSFIKVPGHNWPLHFVGDLQTFCATKGAQEIKKIIRPYLPAKGVKWWLQFVGFRILELVSTNQK